MQPANPTLEILAEDANQVGEAPLWEARRGVLWWLDAAKGLLYQLHPQRREKLIYSLGHAASGLALHGAGGLVIAGGNSLYHWRGPGDSRPLVSQAGWAFNDIIVDAHGRLLAGSTHWANARMVQPGHLLVFEPDGAVRVADSGILMANGLAFSPDQRTLYFADSAARRIYAYDYDLASGTPSQRRILVQVPAHEGLPDGLTVDAEGFLWSAQWYGGQIVRYSPAGQVALRVPLPVTQAASVAFGGNELDQLFITSANDPTELDLAPTGYDFASANRGGQLWRWRAPVAGNLEHACRLSIAG